MRVGQVRLNAARCLQRGAPLVRRARRGRRVVAGAVAYREFCWKRRAMVVVVTNEPQSDF